MQPAALDQRRRVLLAYEAVAKPCGAFPVPLLIRATIRHAPQLLNDRQGEQRDGRKSLLAVDDEELAVTMRLDDQGSHVVTALGIAPHLDDVVPEVLPLLLRPGVVPLVRRNAVRLAVADQLQVAGRARVEDVGPGHPSPPPPVASNTLLKVVPGGNASCFASATNSGGVNNGLPGDQSSTLSECSS